MINQEYQFARSTCERSEHHSLVVRSATELWLWSSSEVHASAPIKLWQGSGGSGHSHQKFFGKFYFLECIFTIEFTFYTCFKMLKIVLYSTSYRLPNTNFRNLSWLNLMLGSRESWSGKYLLSGRYTLLHYTFRIRPSNNLIIYNGDQKTWHIISYT